MDLKGHNITSNHALSDTAIFKIPNVTASLYLSNTGDGGGKIETTLDGKKAFDLGSNGKLYIGHAENSGNLNIRSNHFTIYGAPGENVHVYFEHGTNEVYGKDTGVSCSHVYLQGGTNTIECPAKNNPLGYVAINADRSLQVTGGTTTVSGLVYAYTELELTNMTVSNAPAFSYVPGNSSESKSILRRPMSSDKLDPVILSQGKTIKFYGNDNNIEEESQYFQSVISGTTNLMENLFNRDDYAFAGWNTFADGTGTSYADKAAIPNTGLTQLYAQWKPVVATYTTSEGKSKNYATLAEAVAAASADSAQNGTVTLVQDVDLNGGNALEAAGSGWTLDLNGHSIANTNAPVLEIKDQSLLTVINSNASTEGRITTNASGKRAILCSGVSTLNIGSDRSHKLVIENTHNNGAAIGFIIGAKSLVTIQGGKENIIQGKLYGILCHSFQVSGGDNNQIITDPNNEALTGARDGSVSFTGGTTTFTGKFYAAVPTLKGIVITTPADYSFVQFAPLNNSPYYLYKGKEKDKEICTYSVFQPAGLVSYDANGGTGTMDSQLVYFGQKAKLSKNIFTREDYLFDGWAGSADGDLLYSDEEEVTLSADTTLYARWKKIHTVSFDSEGGTAVDSQKVLDGQTATKPSNPEKEGFLFDGWTLDGAAYDFARKVTGDITLKAAWTQEDPEITYYTVTFDPDNGSAVSKQRVADGECAEKPADPEREGYSFTQWELDGAAYDFARKVTGDLTLKAAWTKKEAENAPVVMKEPMTQVPETRKETYPTVEALEEAMLKTITVEKTGQEATHEFYDVKLVVTVNGVEKAVTADDFPAAGIDVLLPYPEGTGPSDSFQICHMFEYAVNGHRAGEMESPRFTREKEGLRVHFDGLSPVIVSWEKGSEEVEPSPEKDPEVKPETDPGKKPETDPQKGSGDKKSQDKTKSGEKSLLEKLREALANQEQHSCKESDYAWDVTEATETEDGLMEYKCKVCGKIKYSVPVTAYYTFNKNVSQKIRDAKAGTSVRVDTPVFVSFHEMVKDALAANPDVEVLVSYKYQGRFYEMTIPAGTSKETLNQLWNGSKFCGFRNMATVFATTAR